MWYLLSSYVYIYVFFCSLILFFCMFHMIDNLRPADNVKVKLNFYLYIFYAIKWVWATAVFFLAGGCCLEVKCLISRVICVCAPAYRSAVSDNKTLHVAKRHLEGKQGCFSLRSCFECTFSSFCLETQKTWWWILIKKAHCVSLPGNTPLPTAWWITVCYRDEKFHLHKHSLPITKTDTVKSLKTVPCVEKHNNYHQKILNYGQSRQGSMLYWHLYFFSIEVSYVMWFSFFSTRISKIFEAVGASEACHDASSWIYKALRFKELQMCTLL